MVRKNRRMTREQKVAEELQWRRVVDQVQMESEGVEPLLDSFYGCVCAHGLAPSHFAVFGAPISLNSTCAGYTPCSPVRYSTECVALLLTPFIQIFLVLSDAAPFHPYNITEIPVSYVHACTPDTVPAL
jgi:hypothetical protein